MLMGTISLLKQKYGTRRTSLRGFDETHCTVAGVIWANNDDRSATMT